MHILVHILLSCLFIVLRINQSDYVRHARNGTVGEVAQNRSEFAPFPLFYVIKITSILRVFTWQMVCITPFICSIIAYYT